MLVTCGQFPEMAGGADDEYQVQSPSRYMACVNRLLSAGLLGTSFFCEQSGDLEWLALSASDTRLHLYCGIPIRQYVPICSPRGQGAVPRLHAAVEIGKDAFFSPLWLIIARGTKLLGMPMLTGYHLFHWLLYMGAAWPCLNMLDTYLTSRGQRSRSSSHSLYDSISLIGLGIHGILPIRPEIFLARTDPIRVRNRRRPFRGGSSNSPTLNSATQPCCWQSRSLEGESPAAKNDIPGCSRPSASARRHLDLISTAVRFTLRPADRWMRALPSSARQSSAAACQGAGIDSCDPNRRSRRRA